MASRSRRDARGDEATEPPGSPFSRWDAHPFQPASEGPDAPCALCGEGRAQIRHHPTRVRAACLLLGLDPAEVLGRR